MFLNPTYLWMVLIPGLVLGGLATFFTRSTFKRYARIPASTGLTGAQAAARLLEREGIADVGIEATRGFLSDHYDPASRTLRLSPAVYHGRSLAAIGVACHEAGHALQHARKYAPLALRTQLVPASMLGSQLAFPLLIAGLIFRFPMLMWAGVLLFAAAVVFTIITLPVEWNASARAKRLMVSDGIVSPSEQGAAGAVLNAAFLTYVAAAVTAVLSLLYYLGLARRN